MGFGTTSGASSDGPRSSSTARARSAGWKPGRGASIRRARSRRSSSLPPGTEPRLLFLYGTLMRDEPAHRLLVGRATFVDDGHVAGTLVDLGKYPGIVDGPGRVWGEVWRLDVPQLLRTLDDYEGYNFERCRSTAILAGGRRVRVSLYRYR